MLSQGLYRVVGYHLPKPLLVMYRKSSMQATVAVSVMLYLVHTTQRLAACRVQACTTQPQVRHGCYCACGSGSTRVAAHSHYSVGCAGVMQPLLLCHRLCSPSSAWDGPNPKPYDAAAASAQCAHPIICCQRPSSSTQGAAQQSRGLPLSSTQALNSRVLSKTICWSFHMVEPSGSLKLSPQGVWACRSCSECKEGSTACLHHRFFTTNLLRLCMLLGLLYCNSATAWQSLLRAALFQ